MPTIRWMYFKTKIEKLHEIKKKVNNNTPFSPFFRICNAEVVNMSICNAKMDNCCCVSNGKFVVHLWQFVFAIHCVSEEQRNSNNCRYISGFSLCA